MIKGHEDKRTIDVPSGVGAALVLTAAVAAGVTPIAAKLSYGGGLDALSVLTWRFTVGASLAFVFLMLSSTARRELGTLKLRGVIRYAALGLYSAATAAIYYFALEFAAASLVAMVAYLYPSLAVVAAARWGRRLQGRKAWVALLLCSLGAVAALGGAAEHTDPRGLLLALALPFAMAGWFVLTGLLAGERRGMTARERREEGGPGQPSALVYAAITMSATAACFWIASGVTGTSSSTFHLANRTGDHVVLLVFALGLLAAATYPLLYLGLQRLGFARASLLLLAEGLITVFLSVVLLGERLNAIQVAGAALLALGILRTATLRTDAVPMGQCPRR